MLKRVLKVSLCFLLVFVLAGLFLRGCFVVRGVDDAAASVADADVAVRRAFNAALAAERAGANVSGLLLRLDDAGAVLGEAEVALSNGNLSDAADKANTCISMAQSVVSDAGALRTWALAGARTWWWTYLTFSVVGVGVFVVVLAVVWWRFKRGYVGNVLGLKPEAKHNES
jgi:hypothetical protein